MPREGSVTPDRDGYLDIRSRSAVTFDLDARLPDQVFRDRAGDWLFCEIDVVLAPDLWPALCAMARWHGDEHVELLVLEPDCDLYLREGLGYPARSLSVGASEDDYWAAIGFDPDGDDFAVSITRSANVVALTGASGKWGCWAERDPEVAVFQGFPDAATRSEWCERFGPFEDVSGALESYIWMAFGARQPVPDAYAAALSANYGPQSGELP